MNGEIDSLKAKQIELSKKKKTTTTKKTNKKTTRFICFSDTVLI